MGLSKAITELYMLCVCVFCCLSSVMSAGLSQMLNVYNLKNNCTIFSNLKANLRTKKLDYKHLEKIKK